MPRNARACPECGSCEETGWSDDAASNGLGLPDDSFDYNKFVREEFSEEKLKPRGVKWFWWLAAILLLLSLLAFYFR